MVVEKFKIVAPKLLKPAETDFVFDGMPEGYEVKILGRIDPNTYFVIYGPQQFVGYTVWKVAIGPKDAMEAYDVYGVTVFRDGGSTIIRTAKGGFFFPSPLDKKDVKPRFKKKSIELIFRK